MKIYDCFLFSNELELLELRMEILNPYVDYFLLLESPYSFPGKNKELIFEKNKHKFDTSKIIHVICPKLPYIGNVDGVMRRSKRNEWYSRDYMRVGLKDAGVCLDDIIMLSDIDEIPNPKSVIENLDLLNKYPHFGTNMKMFYYYVNYLTPKEWAGTVVCKFKDFNKPFRIRKRRGDNWVENGGWHYSYLGGIDKIQFKVNNLGSIQFNKYKFINKDHLNKCLENGKDLFNRVSMKAHMVDAADHGPYNIMEFVKKYPQFIRK